MKLLLVVIIASLASTLEARGRKKQAPVNNISRSSPVKRLQGILRKRSPQDDFDPLENQLQELINLERKVYTKPRGAGEGGPIEVKLLAIREKQAQTPDPDERLDDVANAPPMWSSIPGRKRRPLTFCAMPSFYRDRTSSGDFVLEECLDEDPASRPNLPRFKSLNNVVPLYFRPKGNAASASQATFCRLSAFLEPSAARGALHQHSGEEPEDEDYADERPRDLLMSRRRKRSVVPTPVTTQLGPKIMAVPVVHPVGQVMAYPVAFPSQQGSNGRNMRMKGADEQEPKDRALYHPGMMASMAMPAMVKFSWMVDPNAAPMPVMMMDPMSLHRITHVVGGHRAALGQFPSMVLFADRIFGNPVCGGTILNENSVLTAGHCLTEYADSNGLDAVRAVVGKLGSDLRSRDPHQQVLPIARVMRHERLIRPAYGFDIAVIKLDGKIKFNRYVKPVRLPTTVGEEPQRDARLTVAGYGLTRDGGPIAPQMLYVNLNYVPDSDCQRLLRSQYNRKLVIRKEQMCAGGEQDKDGCQGDSGGPLYDADGVQVGIVSFGYGCGNPNTPGIYTQVSYFLPWIKRRIT